MSKPLVTVDGASIRALDALSKTLAARMKYLNESVQDGAHAMLSLILRSLRVSTKVAKATDVKVELKERGDLRFSYYATGKRGEFRSKKNLGETTIKVPVKMCVRNAGGVRIKDDSCGKIRFVNCQGVKAKTVKCFEFVDSYETGGTKFADRYLIVAASKGKANRYAKTIVSRRILRYAGLARRAITVLMVKSNTNGPAEKFSRRVNAKAYEVTRTAEAVTQNRNGGVYTLTALDNLRYAQSALKGGSADIDIAIKKAVNKCVGQITHQFKRKDYFDPHDLPPCFPEVKQARRGKAA